MKFPVRVIGNYVYDAGLVGMGFRQGAVVVIEGNMVSGSALPGIAINGAIALKLNHNQVTGARNTPGFVIVNGAVVHEMKGNAADSNKGPRFMLQKSTIIQKAKPGL